MAQLQAQSGFLVVRASRSERLADALAEALADERPANPLASQRVVVAHPGLGRWLLQRWAQQPGPGAARGIAANLSFDLPGAWLGQLMAELLDEPELAAGPFRREPLRWRIHEALAGFRDAAVQRYLDGDDAGRRRFQLADRLAALYTQYLVYRRDWIAAAETGAVRHWQARLWRRLRADIDAPHRGERMAALLDRLDAGALPADSAPLHLFGLNHLPPDTLAVLARLARSIRVTVYFPDPSHDYWPDLVDEARLARLVAEDRADYRETGHPLLAALAAHGQAFHHALTTLAAEPGLNGEDHNLEADDHEPLPLTRLARLQASVRELAPESLRAEDDPADASLRVHACHTRLRELEVLRDALLDRLAADPTLQPRDIVVMAPDIGAYGPLLAAVFGAADDPRNPLPWRLADRALGALHPLLATVSGLLALPSLRLTRSELLALLDLPAIARALGMEPGERELVERWLVRTRVAWGLDARMKQALSGSAEPRFSFAHARDRLMLGWLVGAEPAFEGFMDRMPAAGADGPQAAALGRLDALLELLAEGRATMARSRRASEWSDWLSGWLARLLRPDPADGEEGAAFAAALALAEGLRRECEEAEVDPELDWPTVREALQAQLAEVPSGAPFLGGGVSFCGMVPARVIPFRVVALLGLDDGEFPRDPGAQALNLMAEAPRAGDRDARREDRYLFLESLMSARDVLHLSFRAESPEDGSARNPAAPLAELMELLERQAPARAGTGAAQRPWLVRHALQPFDERYFDGRDPRLFSFRRRFAAVTPGIRTDVQLPPFIPVAHIADDAAPPAIALDELRRAVRDLPAFAISRGLGLALDALEQPDGDDSEGLDARLDARDRLPQRLVFEALARGGRELPTTPGAALTDTGLLPPGASGEMAWTRLRAEVGAVLDWIAREHPDLPGQRSGSRAVEVQLPDGSRLDGHLSSLFRQAGEPLLLALRSGSADPRQLLPLFVDWSALALSLPDTGPLPRALLLQVVFDDRRGVFEVAAHPAPEAWRQAGRDWAGQQLLGLHRLAQAACQRPPPLFPRTVGAWLGADDEARARAARLAWQGNDRGRGERDWSAAARLVARGRDLLDPNHPGHREFLEVVAAVAPIVAPVVAPEPGA